LLVVIYISLFSSCRMKYVTRIIHQAEKSTKESTFDVRVSLSTTTSQAHHEPQSSP
jgi:hypothetical protein